jgi:hypothetical protein
MAESAGPCDGGKDDGRSDSARGRAGVSSFVNADVIAGGLAGFAPESVAAEAHLARLGRLAASLVASTSASSK